MESIDGSFFGHTKKSRLNFLEKNNSMAFAATVIRLSSLFHPYMYCCVNHNIFSMAGKGKVLYNKKAFPYEHIDVLIN